MARGNQTVEMKFIRLFKLIATTILTQVAVLVPVQSGLDTSREETRAGQTGGQAAVQVSNAISVKNVEIKEAVLIFLGFHGQAIKETYFDGEDTFKETAHQMVKAQALLFPLCQMMASIQQLAEVQTTLGLSDSLYVEVKCLQREAPSSRLAKNNRTSEFERGV